MSKSATPIKSFAALAAVLHAEDVRKAQNLRKVSGLHKARPAGTGPIKAR